MTADDLDSGNIGTGGQFREFLSGLIDENCLAGIFTACLSPIVYSRHHWLKYKGEYRVRADLRGALEGLQARAVTSWDDEESDFVLALYALSVSAVGLDELNDSAGTEAVREVLDARYDLYAAVAGPASRPDQLLTLARRVSELRSVVARTHLLYSIIDGKAWHRTEGLLAHDRVDLDSLTPPMARVLSEDFPVSPDGESLARLAQATRACLHEHGESAPLVRAIMAATLRDEVLRGDHVTLTCPQGDLLGTPELMTTSEAFFTETQLREGLDLDDYADRLGDTSPEQVQRTIRARMLKLKRGAIRGLYGPGCIQGRFVEKHGGHMIFRNEDAHYRGHQSIGCSSGGRASIALRYQRDGKPAELTPMVGDYRVVRMSHDDRDTFTGDELAHVIRYAEWIRAVVEETYRLGEVVRRDASQPAALSLTH
jgi:hypothetical protein